MGLIDGIPWAEVAAFIGPLIAAIGLLGGLIAWIMTRTARYVQQQVTQVQSVTNERIATLAETLKHQGEILERQQASIANTSVTVARIEGRLQQAGESHGGSS